MKIWCGLLHPSGHDYHYWCSLLSYVHANYSLVPLLSAWRPSSFFFFFFFWRPFYIAFYKVGLPAMIGLFFFFFFHLGMSLFCLHKWRFPFTSHVVFFFCCIQYFLFFSGWEELTFGISNWESLSYLELAELFKYKC